MTTAWAAYCKDVGEAVVRLLTNLVSNKRAEDMTKGLPVVRPTRVLTKDE